MFRKIVKVCSESIQQSSFLSFYLHFYFWIFGSSFSANANSITQHRFTFPYGVSNRPFGDILNQRLQTEGNLLIIGKKRMNQPVTPSPKKGFRFSSFLPSLFRLELNYPSQNVTKQMPHMKMLMKISKFEQNLISSQYKNTN